MSKHYKVNTMEGKGEAASLGFGPGKSHLYPFINTNQYVVWTRLNDQRYKLFSRIKKGDTLHILKSKTDKKKVYYKGEVLSDLIIDDKYTFSKNILQWDWEKMSIEHNGKKEMKFIVYWEKQPYPNNELYNKIMAGFNAQTVKYIYIL